MLAVFIIYSGLRVYAQFEDVTDVYSLYVESNPGVVREQVHHWNTHIPKLQPLPLFLHRFAIE